MKNILNKVWDFLVVWGDTINEYRRKNPRINAWY